MGMRREKETLVQVGAWLHSSSISRSESFIQRLHIPYHIPAIRLHPSLPLELAKTHLP